MIQKIFLATIAFCGIFLCCCHQYPTQINYTLELSGKNRNELEKLIHHYMLNPSDSIKLKAALFLIENMPGHVTLTGEEIEKNNIEVAQARNKLTYFEKKVLQMVPLRNFLLRPLLHAEEDIRSIKANDLIHHIDRCFELWHTRPWLKNIGSNDFFEYLLPYRAEEEQLDYWIDSCALPEEELHQILCYYDDIKYSVTQIGNYMERYISGTSLLYRDSTKKAYITDCTDVSLIKLFRYRSLGIPCAIDYVPCWSGAGGAHHWLRVMDPAYKNGGVPQVFRRTAKIYRRTFSIQDCPREIIAVSPVFKDVFNRDVTDEYLTTSDISLSLPEAFSSGMTGYLTVFHQQQWTPVAWGKVSGQHITFQKMGREVVYLPVYYKNELMRHWGYPFLIDDQGKRHTFIPDKKNLHNLRLSRKYPRSMQNVQTGDQIIGCYWLGANRKDFQDSVILHRIDSNSGMAYITKHLNGEEKYRYFKCIFPQRSNIAELHFTGPQGEIKGKVLTPCLSGQASYLNDGDPLTYFESQEILEIDFGSPRSITEISFLPPNDGNGIYPGHLYELFYFDEDGWQSLGKKEGNNSYLEYDHIPSEALYWLRDLTTGIEERIFTYRDGEVRFR